MLSKVGLKSFVSWTLAPATATLRGPPAASTRMLFLLPALPRSVGLRPMAPPKTRFAYRAIRRLPFPVHAAQLLAFFYQDSPDGLQCPTPYPALEGPMDGAVVPQLLGQVVPLAAASQPKDNPFLPAICCPTRLQGISLNNWHGHLCWPLSSDFFGGHEHTRWYSFTPPQWPNMPPPLTGKAQVEDMLKGLGVPYTIIRPTVVFGVGDLLLNNMAWALRRFPVFPVYGSGDYPVQPIYVEDLAAQAVEAGSLSESSVADAAGPDTLSFEALLRLLASSIDVRRWFLHTPPRVGLALTGLVGLLMRDMALTRHEVVGLMDGLLTSDEPPTGTTRVSDWLAENGDGLGRRYVSELRRNYRPG